MDMLKFCRLLCLLFISVGITYAQEPLTPIYTGFPWNWYWSSDSQRFVFDDVTIAYIEESFDSPAVFYPADFWFEYDVTTGSLNRGDVWSLQPALTNADFDNLQILGSTTDTQTIVFPHHNGLFAYIENSGAIGISDGSNFVTTTEVTTWSPYIVLADFNFQWNETGTALTTYNRNRNLYRVNYVTSFGSPNSLTTPDSVRFSGRINSRYFMLPFRNFPAVFDVATNAHEVLMLVDDSTNDGQADEVPIIWKPFDIDNSIILDNLQNRSIESAAFVEDDDSRFVFIDETGVHLYDRNLQTSSLLTSDYNTSDFLYVRFSPDGNWLAVLRDGNLYMIDLSSFIRDILDSTN